jgi:hypothetical protein
MSHNYQVQTRSCSPTASRISVISKALPSYSSRLWQVQNPDFATPAIGPCGPIDGANQNWLLDVMQQSSTFVHESVLRQPLATLLPRYFTQIYFQPGQLLTQSQP